MKIDTYIKAFHERDMSRFLDLMLPKEWVNLKPVLLSTGVKFTESTHWCPGWSDIPLTIRGNESDFNDMAVRSSIFRFHDCIHNLWPQPTNIKNQNWNGEFFDDRDNYVQVQIAGELVVLAITECVYPNMLMHTADDTVARILMRKHSVRAWDFFDNFSIERLALLFKSVLVDKDRLAGTRLPPDVQGFIDYFSPMLSMDQTNSIHNRTLLKTWHPGFNFDVTYSHDPIHDMCLNFSDMIEYPEGYNESDEYDETDEWDFCDFDGAREKHNKLIYIPPAQRINVFPPTWS